MFKKASTFSADSLSKAVSAGGVEERDGVRVQRFIKDIIREGTFTGEDGNTATIGGDDLDNFVTQFAAMKKNGVRVPCPVMHTDDPEANRGYVEEMWREGDRVFAQLELIGDDAIQLASRCDVSIFSPGDWKDGEGREYSRPITHVALVTDPAVPKLGKFVPFAASGAGIETSAVTRYSMEQPKMTFDFKALAKSLGVDEQVDEKNVLDVVQNRMTAMNKSIEDGKSEVDRLTAEVASLKKTDDVDPEVVGMLAEGAATQIDALAARGNITPGVGTALKTLFGVGGGDAKPLTFALRSGQPGKPSLVKQVCEALSKNDPVAIGRGVTPSQAVALRGPTAKQKEEADEKAKTLEESATLAYGSKKTG